MANPPVDEKFPAYLNINSNPVQYFVICEEISAQR
jgi:hypothetical protein